MTVTAAPRMSEGTDSGSSTFQTISKVVAPMVRAASTTPRSISPRDCSTMRATKGAAATTSGTMVAVVP